MNVERILKVKTFEEGYQSLLADPKNKILGGGLWLKKTGADISTLIDLSSLSIKSIIDKGDSIEVGALVTLRELETSSTIESLNDGIITKAVREIMGPAFKNSATIGGTIVGKYSFSDLNTSLLALDPTLNFYKQGPIKLSTYFSDLTPTKDILMSISIKKVKGKSYFKKVRTTALDYPIINIAVSNTDKVNIVVGSRPMIPIKVCLDDFNMPKTKQNLIKFVDLVANTVMVKESIGVSKDYRELLMKTYIQRGLEEVL